MNTMSPVGVGDPEYPAPTGSHAREQVIARYPCLQRLDEQWRWATVELGVLVGTRRTERGLLGLTVYGEDRARVTLLDRRGLMVSVALGALASVLPLLDR